MNGFVYVQTNDAEQNEVVVFGRKGDGTLERLSAYLTGGKGSGAPHLPSQSSVVLDDGRLFVTNAGSDDVTVFGVDGAELGLVDRVASGGSTPTNNTKHNTQKKKKKNKKKPNKKKNKKKKKQKKKKQKKKKKKEKNRRRKKLFKHIH
jgi:Na+/glutamate symporter